MKTQTTRTMKNKFTYYKIIQGSYDGGKTWSDEDFHETNSLFRFQTREARDYFKENLRAYLENGNGSYRVIRRREIEDDFDKVLRRVFTKNEPEKHQQQHGK